MESTSSRSMWGSIGCRHNAGIAGGDIYRPYIGTRELRARNVYFSQYGVCVLFESEAATAPSQVTEKNGKRVLVGSGARALQQH